MKKILLIDDEEMMIKVITKQLEDEGYEIISTTESREVAELVKKHQPDLLISDIMMPYISGLELLNTIKTSETKTIPVILISSLDQMEVIHTAVELGADDFIIKPINTDELSIRVKRLLYNS